MRVSCPNCAAEVESDPGELAACSACGHWWIAEEPAPPADDEAFEPAAPTFADDGEMIDLEAVAADTVAAPAPEPALTAEAPLPPRERRAIAPLPRPTPAPEDHPWEFELQLGVGDKVEGPFDRMYLREHLYMGRLTGDERVRVPGATAWARLGDRPEFAEVLHLLGKDEPAVVGNKRIAGWQKAGPGNVTGAAPRPTPAASAPPAPLSAAPAPAPAAPAAGGVKGPLVAVAIVVVVAALAAAAGMLFMR
jgi:2-oxoglutarate dehydrogenase E2 component (dihydrolipoamide succinyltransferase)